MIKDIILVGLLCIFVFILMMSSFSIGYLMVIGVL